MSTIAPTRRSPGATVRSVRLRALWLPASVLLTLAALGSAATTVRNVVALVGTSPSGAPATPAVVSVLVGGLMTLVLGRVAWRLAVEVPRLLRAWDQAFDERRRALAD